MVDISIRIVLGAGVLKSCVFRHFLILALSLWACGLHAQSPNLHLGDVDDDNVITVRDIALIVEHVKGTLPLGEHHAVLADVTKDGAVNQADVDELIKEVLETRTPENLPLSTVRFTSPAAGEGDVSVNRETVVHFTVPLAINAMLDTTKFYAEFAGRKVLSRVEISSDRKKASLFYLEPLPANSRVKVTFDGSGLDDLLGRPFDGNGNGLEASALEQRSEEVYRMSFDTHSSSPIPATGVTGRVLMAAPEASATVPPGFANMGVPGVTITVDGQEQTMRTTTDAQGYFTLSPCPSGVFFVHIDGRTSPWSAYPNGQYFPVVGKQWQAVPGKADNLATGTGLVYLPCVCAGTLQPTSQTQATTVAFPQQVLTLNPTLASTTVEVPANAVFSDDGTRGGKIGIAPVPADRLPSPLPPGLNLPLVITVQSDGATNLDRPAPVCFPNLPDPVTGIKPGPGEKSALWSFNHDTGQWEVVGPMTVTADGNFVKSDVGVGIRQPGWHGAQEGTQNEQDAGDQDEGDQDDPCQQLVRAAALSALQSMSSAADVAAPIAAGLETAASVTPVGRGAKVIAFAVGAIGSQVRSGLDVKSTLEAAAQDAYFKLGNAINEGTQNPQQFLNDFTTSLLDAADGAANSVLNPIGEYGNTLSDFADSVSDTYSKTSAAVNCYTGSTQAGTPSLASLNSAALSPQAQEADVGNDYLELCSALGLPEPSPADASSFAALTAKLASQRTQLPMSFQKLNAEAELLTSAFHIAKNPQPTFEDMKAVHAKIGAFLNRIRDVRHFASDFRTEMTQMSDSANSLTNVLGNFNVTKSKVYTLHRFNSTYLRGVYDSGRMTTILPAMTFVEVRVYDAAKKKIGGEGYVTGPSGSRQKQGQLLLFDDQGADTDSDTLSDEAEAIIGTDPNDDDTDNDGVTDGAEVKNGTDPLSGIAAATGIVGKAETGGDCRDVTAVNDVLAAACGAEGLQLLGVRQGLSPTKLAKVATPSPATVVAMTGSLVAVGMGSGGTMIVDASTPDTPQVLRTIKLGSSVKSLAAVENTVYIGFEDGRITGVDMLTGRLLANVNLGSAVHDLAIGNGVLYAATVGSLKAVPVTATGTFGTVASLAMSANVGAGQQRLRLFRGTDRLYAVHTSGYNVFNLTTPTAPVFIRNNTDGAFGWRHIVANGSGLALAATGPNSTDDGPHDVSLYTLGPDNAQANFVTTFDLPGASYASSFYNGLAYVADGTAGVQVVNIRPFDALKVAPTITLSAQATGGVVTEGTFIPVSALVTDDVQVRNVEFYVDGVKVETDGNFPFETRVLAPRIVPGKTTVTLKAKATDTGGNFTWSSEIVLNLTADTTPLTVLSMSPPNAAIMAQCSGFTLKFSEPVKSSTLTSSTVRFYAAGPDARIGTDDDTAVTATLLAAANDSGTNRDTASWQSTTPLAPGTYRVLATLGVQDTAGNPLAAPFSGVFVVSGGTDSDGDGLADDVEIALGYDPNNQDSNGNGKADGDEDFDGDLLSNAFEIRYGLQPNNSDSNGNDINDRLEDTDRDGLTNVQELAAGTDPTKADTDGDGWPDQVEIQFASNPADARSKPLSMIMGAAPVIVVSGNGSYISPPVLVEGVGGSYGTTIAAPPISLKIEQ